jgi:hypothetical protein
MDEDEFIFDNYNIDNIIILYKVYSRHVIYT